MYLFRIYQLLDIYLMFNIVGPLLHRLRGGPSPQVCGWNTGQECWLGGGPWLWLLSRNKVTRSAEWSMILMRLVWRIVPVRTAGCYVPGGLYGYTVSAVMTAGVARAAGVSNIICSAPTNKRSGKIHPNTLYAMKKAGATQILALGGVQVDSIQNI